MRRLGLEKVQKKGLEEMANTFENCNTIKQRVVGSNPSRDASLAIN
jgi:hypothetical protein